jgi:hypothetical protein
MPSPNVLFVFGRVLTARPVSDSIQPRVANDNKEAVFAILDEKRRE